MCVCKCLNGYELKECCECHGIYRHITICMSLLDIPSVVRICLCLNAYKHILQTLCKYMCMCAPLSIKLFGIYRHLQLSRNYFLFSFFAIVCLCI